MDSICCNTRTKPITESASYTIFISDDKKKIRWPKTSLSINIISSGDRLVSLVDRSHCIIISSQVGLQNISKSKPKIAPLILVRTHTNKKTIISTLAFIWFSICLYSVALFLPCLYAPLSNWWTTVRERETWYK